MIGGMTDNLPPITDEDDYSDDDFLAELAEEVLAVEDAPVEEIAPDEEVVIPVPAVEETPKPKPAKAETKKSTFSASAPPATQFAVVSNADTDEVFLSKCVPHNKRAMKSLTVHHIQRRLREWGFSIAYADKDGYYGDLTIEGVRQFQESLGLETTGLMDADTFTRLFEGDTNVTVRLT